MHFRPFRSSSALTLASFVVLLGVGQAAHAAGAKDKDAQKLLDSAMNDDYLATEFAKAEKKLKDAIAKCGSSDCSADLLGKLHIALGTVYGVGLSKESEAKAELVAALKADPKAALDPSLTTPELSKLFEEAKKSAGKGGGSGGSSGSSSPKPTGDAQHTPPAEAPVNTPLPIYVEPNDEVPLSKVVLRYKPFGESQYKSVEMKKVGKGYGVEIPCADVTTTGDIKYFFAFTGQDGEAAGGLGSSKEPFRVTIKNEIEGDAPKLPGKKAPDKCTVVDCPPGLAGCPEKKKHGDKGWGASCEAATECKDGLTCLNGSCEEDKGGGGGGGGGGGAKKKMNMVFLGVQLDWLNIASATDVCSAPASANDPPKPYACFERDITGKVKTNNQFFGNPVPKANTNGIAGGLAFADVRILAGYERQLVEKIGLTLGVRGGVAIGGSPTPANTREISVMGQQVTVGPAGSNLAISAAYPYKMYHVELRASYYILGNMLEKLSPRPYVFIGGGAAQVNASVPVTVCDKLTPSTKDPGKSGCPQVSSDPSTWASPKVVDAYQITGLGFIGFGGGMTLGFTPNFGIAVEAKFMMMVPTFGFVISPTIGPVVAF